MKARKNRDQIVVSTKLLSIYPGCDGGLSAVEIQRELREEPEETSKPIGSTCTMRIVMTTRRRWKRFMEAI